MLKLIKINCYQKYFIINFNQRTRIIILKYINKLYLHQKRNF